MDNEASSSTISPGNFDEFNSSLQIHALKTTRNALALPSDVAFHRSIDSTFAGDLDEFSSRVLSLTNKLLSLTATADTSQSSRSVKGKGKLENQDDLVDHFHSLVVDSMDQLLERTDICLDEYLGVATAPAIAVNPPKQAQPKVVKRGPADHVIQHASHLQKPQVSFKRKVDNTDSPWYPTLSHKYNAQVPLGYDYRDVGADPTSSVLISTYPYRYEITHICYPERMFQIAAPSQPAPIVDTPFTWVSTPQLLEAMLAKLRQASEVAIDLEHHSYRSYAGFVCLMQISTREEDWVVDALALREELTELNEIFTDPRIVKVFHGADSDIVWLQQDFNLYVVNLFDTYHASKALDFPRHGLANLLEMYCDFTPDKRYQLADWRIRPLPKDMLEYARSDTHFLLYIYDNLRNALLDRGRSQSGSRSGSPSGSSSNSSPASALLKQVLARSEETSLKTYEKEVYDAHRGTGSNGWEALARKWNKGALLAGGPGVGVGALQRAVYRVVHKWRDAVAREEDESIRYVLPNHFLFQLAEQPPADMAALLRTFHPVPPVIRRRVKELLDTIRDCVKIQLSSTSSVPTPASEEENSIYVDTVEHSEASGRTPQSEPSTLWAHASRSSSVHVAVSTSSLFGETLQQSQGHAAFSAANSFLFGNMGLNLYRRHDPHFQEVVARINSKLVIAPSAPKIIQEIEKSPNEPATGETNEKEPEMLGMQVEIPFVPASGRKPAQTVEDSIVVVGQARQKKRKRSAKSIQGGPAPGASHSSADGVQANNQRAENLGNNLEKPFDFADVPNILDNNPSLEDTKKLKRQKKQKQGGNFYGDFPAPPKAHSELKSGNQSHTFR